MFRKSLFSVSLAGLSMIVSATTFGAVGNPAADEQPTPPRAILVDDAMAQGTIMRVDMDKQEFVLKVPGDKNLTVKFDEKTKFLVDGKDTMAEEALKALREAKVFHKKGLALKVEIIAPA